MGSPLTHGNLLMADSNADFNLRIEEREFPVCPPVKDGERFTYENSEGQNFLHHATPFAVTRWTNLFYKGDLIGGTLANRFGVGIQDIEVAYSGGGWWKDRMSKSNPLTHNHYWASTSTVDNISNLKEYTAIKKLYDAMRFNDLRHKLYD